MFVSKDVDYAVRTLVALAEAGPLLLREISDQYRIPYNFVALVLPKLKRSGLVEVDLRDKKERFFIVKTPDTISLWEIVTAMTGKFDILVAHPSEPTELEKFPQIEPFWKGLALHIEKFLHEKFLSELMKPIV